ncbi:MAG: PEP/pyruvate-binding domain-containing protein [Gaiellaceae bacterium]
MSDLRAVSWLGQPDAQEISLVGGKAAPLGVLARDEHRVPAGFVLTTHVQARLELEGGDCLRDVVETNYRLLAERLATDEPAVAVRSSAVDEDGAEASFAGQHATFLNVAGAGAVTEAAVACFESASTEQALEYRRRFGLAVDGIRMAVIVQELVSADTSAIAFSANPLTNSTQEIVINASWGLGESIAGGTVTPDTYVVAKRDLTISSRLLGAKEEMTVPIDGGTREVGVPAELRDQHSLDDEAIVELAELAISLERRMGHPVDIESAFCAGRLYVLQCRRITTLR